MIYGYWILFGTWNCKVTEHSSGDIFVCGKVCTPLIYICLDSAVRKYKKKNVIGHRRSFELSINFMSYIHNFLAIFHTHTQNNFLSMDRLTNKYFINFNSTDSSAHILDTWKLLKLQLPQGKLTQESVMRAVLKCLLFNSVY